MPRFFSFSRPDPRELADLKAGHMSKINPDEIRHISGNSEKSFTSTGAKLNAHST